MCQRKKLITQKQVSPYVYRLVGSYFDNISEGVMNKLNQVIRVVFFLQILFSVNSARADISDSIECREALVNNVAYTIPYQTAISCDRGVGSVTYSGDLTNYGEFTVAPGFNLVLEGGIENYGTLNIYYELQFRGNAAVITNRASGIVNSPEWLFVHSGKFDNYGTVNFAPIHGDAALGDNLLAINGAFNNFGTCRFDDSIGSAGGAGAFKNQGKFEITSRGNFPKEDYQESFNYVQTKGEIEVNGFFRAKSVNISGGRLSGNGTLKIDSGTASIVGSKGVISPGAPIGTLTISKADLILGGSLDIELSGPQNNDKLNVDGSLNLSNTYLNVLLRPGFLPPIGTQFTIANATHITGQFLVPVLPKLPFGACWLINYTDTAVMLETSGGGNSSCID